MGKGGYHGGSTIIYIKQSAGRNDEENLFQNSIRYLCKICNQHFFADLYFDHLRKHGLEGCYQCGESYDPKNPVKNNVRICQKCGKRTPVLVKNSFDRLSVNCNKNHAEAKNKNVPNRNADSKKTNKKSNDKFCLSIGELMMKAIKKKND